MQCLASNINMKLRHRTRTLVPLFLQHECAAWVGQQEDWTGLPGFATNFLPHYYCYKILEISASLLFLQGRGPTIPTSSNQHQHHLFCIKPFERYSWVATA